MINSYSSHVLCYEGLSNDDASEWQGEQYRLFQEVSPGAGFKAGDFVLQETFGGGLLCNDPIVEGVDEPSHCGRVQQNSLWAPSTRRSSVSDRKDDDFSKAFYDSFEKHDRVPTILKKKLLSNSRFFFH